VRLLTRLTRLRPTSPRRRCHHFTGMRPCAVDEESASSASCNIFEDFDWHNFSVFCYT
jgi:hypothetical protein